MQATQPLRTFNPVLAGFVALAAAAILAVGAAVAAIAPTIGSAAGTTSGQSGVIEVRRTLDDLYGGAGAIEVRRTTDDLYGGPAPLVLDEDAAAGAGQRGVHAPWAQ